MSFIFTLTLTIVTAIAKYAASTAVGGGVQGQLAQDLLDLVRDRIGDSLSGHDSDPNVEQIAAQVMQKLTDFLVHEGRALSQETQEVVLFSVGRTLALGKIDADWIIQQRIDPTRMVEALTTGHANQTVALSEDERSLYRRLLHESCRQLANLANLFASYEPLVDRNILHGQDRLLAQMARLLAEPDERSRRFEDAYRQQLGNQLNKFEQIGIDYAEKNASRQSLDVAYVSLRLSDEMGSHRQSRLDGSRQRFSDERDERPIRTVGSIQEMLSHAPRLAIQGQPGSGKSTLLRWLAVQTAQHALSTEHPALASWDDCVPFYLQLRSFVNKPLPNPLDWATQQVDQLALKPPEDWMHGLLSDGRALVLIDGVDETPEAQRPELLDWLQKLVKNYPWARFLITSRPAALKLWPEWIEWSREAGFLTLSLQEMELEQSFGFIEQWHDALLRTLTEPSERNEVSKLAEPLKQLLRQRDPLRKLARNPLLCSMICALHREHPDDMPQNRIRLYQDCVELLMYRRDAKRKVGSLADYPPLSNVHEEVILRDYAHHLMLNGESEEDTRDADRYFDELLQRVNLQGWSGEKLRHYFVARTGLLTDPAEGRIAFTHRTFQEFLAAREIVKRNEIGMLLKRARNDQWRETILLTIGIPEISAKQSERLLTGLLNRADELTTANARHELYLLAVACLETAIYLSPPMRRHILDKTTSLIPPRNNEAIALLARGGDPLVERLRLNPQHSLKKMARCVRTLIAIGSEQSLAAIADYATSPFYVDEKAWALRQAIASGLFAFDPKYYCQRILHQVATVDLSSTQVSDAGLAHLAGLSGLQSLSLWNTKVSDAGLAHLARLSGLQSLSLWNTKVSDAGLAHLAGLSGLQSLYLSSTKLSDAGLAHLAGLSGLQSLDLSGTQVKDISLLEQIPGLDIEWDG